MSTENPHLPSPVQPDQPKAKASRMRPVEFVLVATMASVIGVMAVPDFAPGPIDMAGLAQLTQLQYQVDSYRGALENYRSEHRVYPGFTAGKPGAWLHGELSSYAYRNQLVLWSDKSGHSGMLTPGRMELGPYLEKGLPKNPINGLNTVLLLPEAYAFPDVPDETTGWYFKPKTGELRPNCKGKSVITGQSYYQL